MRRTRKISPFKADLALLLAFGGLSACAPSGPQAAVGATAALPTGTIVAVRHADPDQSAAALGQIMSILGQQMPGNTGPGTEVVIKMQDGSVESITEPTNAGFAAGQTVTVTKTPDGVAVRRI